MRLYYFFYAFAWIFWAIWFAALILKASPPWAAGERANLT